MNRKWLIPAGIFLAIALILPPYILIAQNDADVDNLLNKAPDLSDSTQRQGVTEDIDNNNFAAYTTAFIIEIIAVILFIVTLWLAIKP